LLPEGLEALAFLYLKVPATFPLYWLSSGGLPDKHYRFKCIDCTLDRSLLSLKTVSLCNGKYSLHYREKQNAFPLKSIRPVFERGKSVVCGFRRRLKEW
jgi:hypothetical protein